MPWDLLHFLALDLSSPYLEDRVIYAWPLCKPRCGNLQCFSNTAEAQTQLECLSTFRTDILQFLYLHTSSAVSPVYRLWSTCHSELYELRRAKQAERWQVRFGVKESKEIHLKKNSLPVPTGWEVWKKQLQLRREILGWSLTALRFQLRNFSSERRKTTCLASSARVTRQKGTFYRHLRSPYPENGVWLGSLHLKDIAKLKKVQRRVINVIKGRVQLPKKQRF